MDLVTFFREALSTLANFLWCEKEVSTNERVVVNEAVPEEEAKEQTVSRKSYNSDSLWIPKEISQKLVNRSDSRYFAAVKDNENETLVELKLSRRHGRVEKKIIETKPEENSSVKEFRSVKRYEDQISSGEEFTNRNLTPEQEREHVIDGNKKRAKWGNDDKNTTLSIMSNLADVNDVEEDEYEEIEEENNNIKETNFENITFAKATQQSPIVNEVLVISSEENTFKNPTSEEESDYTSDVENIKVISIRDYKHSVILQEMESQLGCEENDNVDCNSNEEIVEVNNAAIPTNLESEGIVQNDNMEHDNISAHRDQEKECEEENKQYYSKIDYSTVRNLTGLEDDAGVSNSLDGVKEDSSTENRFNVSETRRAYSYEHAVRNENEEQRSLNDSFESDISCGGCNSPLSADPSMEISEEESVHTDNEEVQENTESSYPGEENSASFSSGESGNYVDSSTSEVVVDLGRFWNLLEESKESETLMLGKKDSKDDDVVKQVQQSNSTNNEKRPFAPSTVHDTKLLQHTNFDSSPQTSGEESDVKSSVFDDLREIFVNSQKNKEMAFYHAARKITFEGALEQNNSEVSSHHLPNEVIYQPPHTNHHKIQALERVDQDEQEETDDEVMIWADGGNEENQRSYGSENEEDERPATRLDLKVVRHNSNSNFAQSTLPDGKTHESGTAVYSDNTFQGSDLGVDNILEDEDFLHNERNEDQNTSRDLEKSSPAASDDSLEIEEYLTYFEMHC